MKILDCYSLAFPEVKVIRYKRFGDHRGYFSEIFRHSDFNNPELLACMNGLHFTQANESWSKNGTIRGMHFQWNPYMGKLVRTSIGHMMDMVLDIRQGSPSYGQIILHDMPSLVDQDWSEWIWVPVGFAHGSCFLMDSMIQYYCTGEWSPGCERSISPLAPDIDWSRCDPVLKARFDAVAPTTPYLTDKDRNGLTMASWKADPASREFVYELPARRRAA